ncbi:cupin domain-containing protein, partial [Sinomonas sp. G460-2]|uniref:cupin domain-containing protein n=1 Tax=Sinomonas sp. G460-2 TaxID=3393464 RepID=UPI0039F1025F
MTGGAHVGFPGGTALTRIDVYDWPAEDGAAGGTPHLHTASTEAYLVIGGRGRVETLRLSGYEEHELEPGNLLWFSPGTIHRLVNLHDLQLLVVMTNAGLPEAGDAVMTFAASDVADPERYAKAAALDPADPEGSAQRRRDAALAEYGVLKAAARQSDFGPLREFQAAAARLVAPRVPHWKE